MECCEVPDESESVDLPMLDDLPAAPISAQNAIDILEIIEAGEGLHSTAVASQLDPEEWYVRAEGETVADPIPGCLASARPNPDVDGPNMRERLAENKGGRAGRRPANAWYQWDNGTTSGLTPQTTWLQSVPTAPTIATPDATVGTFLPNIRCHFRYVWYRGRAVASSGLIRVKPHLNWIS